MPMMDFEIYLPSEASAEERRAALADLAHWEDKAGIEMAVVMPSPSAAPNNRALIETLNGDPRWIPCAQVNPNAPGAVDDVRHAVTTLGCRMLKVMPALYNAPPLGAPVRALMDLARELHFPVNIHSTGLNGDPLEIGAIARRYPDVPIIMDHMGYRNDGRAAIAAAEDNPNIWLGTTIASFEPSFIATAINAVGAARIIFGSNLPICYPDLALEALRRGNFGQEAETLIFGGNLARMLDIQQ
ncbi:MAG: amidohydrolase family protein [Chloroflexota bacterium]|nr:amidohydrolase family protein [Chloroflexota bacterium]MDQ6906324.1 amidohydrolase family protein [Chloroflexota bacterium]